ncbi:MAG: DUF350 domain-containing protein [Firmicutes bacterium]|nr:DUF350 domain-containing protein [Bacillota bacterium]
MNIWQVPEIATVYWAVAGFALGWLGLIAFDLTTPYNLRDELKEKNPAIGIVMAGLMFSIGLIIHSSMLYTDTLINAAKYAGIGITLNIVFYHMINLITPGWNLHKAIDDHNQGAAWFVFGLFVLVGYVVSGAIS